MASAAVAEPASAAMLPPKADADRNAELAVRIKLEYERSAIAKLRYECAIACDSCKALSLKRSSQSIEHSSQAGSCGGPFVAYSVCLVSASCHVGFMSPGGSKKVRCWQILFVKVFWSCSAQARETRFLLWPLADRDSLQKDGAERNSIRDALYQLSERILQQIGTSRTCRPRLQIVC